MLEENHEICARPGPVADYGKKCSFCVQTGQWVFEKTHGNEHPDLNQLPRNLTPVQPLARQGQLLAGGCLMRPLYKVIT